MEGASRLDVGLSLQLWELAGATDRELCGVAWLAAACVQAFLEDAAGPVLLDALVAEREAASAKQYVARNVIHVATLSRDLAVLAVCAAAPCEDKDHCNCGARRGHGETADLERLGLAGPGAVVSTSWVALLERGVHRPGCEGCHRRLPGRR